jgi:predicted nucleic acid-binding protein
MPFEPQVVILDACVLYPFHLRNLLMQCAVDGLLEAHWSEEIHDEWIRNLATNNPGLSRERLQKTRTLMDLVLPEATVHGYEDHISRIRLPDMGDRHVLAAGISAGATTIITWNVRDFPSEELQKHGMTRQTPDHFLLDLYFQLPSAMVATTANARHNLRRSEPSAIDFLNDLRRQGLVGFVDEIAKHMADR